MKNITTKTRKLQLSRETVRELQDQDIKNAAGGQITTQFPYTLLGTLCTTVQFC